MHQEALGQDTTDALALLARQAFIKRFYLAGGTGMALSLGHRLSYDLDFFCQNIFDADALLKKIKKVGSFILEEKEEGTLHGMLDGARVTFLQYPYRLLYQRTVMNHIALADPRDIACMKLDAIATRGSKKDFVDVYFFAKQSGMTLGEMVRMFARKYKDIRYNEMHLYKSLVYFVNARRDPMPRMLTPCEWRDVEQWFETETKKLL
ncbi:MAG: nucleotidyl transferase AbiEii/AbiGii toxin family protein [Patescibacteria group bacterium]